MITRDKLVEIVGEDKADEVLEVLKAEQKGAIKPAQVYTMTKLPEGKMNAQVKALAETAVGLNTFTLPELGDAAKENGSLETKQEPAKVASFYRKKLMELGMEAVDDTTETA